MASYHCQIRSRRPVADVFAYMAAFDNATEWDPSVREARRVTPDPIGAGSRFELVVALGGRRVTLDYAIATFEPTTRLVLEARTARFTSRDTLTFASDANGCVMTYDAALVLHGAARLVDPVMQLAFTRLGRRAEAGLRRVLAAS